MIQNIVGVMIALGWAYVVAFGWGVMSEFSLYCDSLAKAAGLERERQSIRNTDEGGLNAFEREQFWRLMRGDPLTVPDQVIAARARKVTRRFLLSYLQTATLLVATVVFIEYWPR